MVSLDKIQAFRDEVNQDKFVGSKYIRINGKNQWGCICASMDWITEGIEYLQNVHITERGLSSMEMYAYISAIDVVWEGIQQLRRVLYPYLRDLPFSGEYECFQNRLFDKKDDNNYFKEIRACFGAHPVNLQGENAQRLFAGWAGSFDGDEYSVLLYSSSPDEPYRKMTIFMHELNAFLEKRYGYLDVLAGAIRKQRAELDRVFRKPEGTEAKEPLEQLEILKKEIKKRGEADYWRGMTDRLQIIFEAEITNEENQKLVERYRNRLMPLMEALYILLQNMDMGDIDDRLLFPHSSTLPNGYLYWLEKIEECIHGVGYPETYWEQHLRQIFDGYIALEYKSYEEFYVVILACLNELK